VDLPALATEANASQEPEPLEPRRSRHISTKVRTSSTTGRRILVVEDEPTVARLIADVLEDEGYQVIVLLDGREALERAARESFDLIICDVKMPGLDGQQFYKSLKRAGSPLSSRFLFVTGDTIGPHTREFLTQHRLPYLSKPFRVEELTEHVQQALSHPDSILRPVSTKRSAARNG
jgi:CheY-like chemotaxis protein